MAQPTGNDPVWCTTPDGTHLNVEPSGGQKTTGWAVNQVPPSSYFNWWQNKVGEWVVYLKNLASEAFTWAAFHTFGVGLEGIGDGSNPGVVGTGGVGTGVEGSSNSRGVVGRGNSGTAGIGVEGRGGDAGGTGVYGEGGGTGHGVTGKGGASGGSGVYGEGTDAGTSGVRGQGASGGQGGTFDGGAGARGLEANGEAGGALLRGIGTGNGAAVVSGSTCTGAALSVDRGDASTSADVIDANGYINMDGASYPTGTTAIKDRLTPKHMLKGYAHFTLVNGSNPTVLDNLNVTSVTNSGGTITVTWAQDFATDVYLILPYAYAKNGGTSAGRNVAIACITQSAGSASFEFYKMTDSTTHTEADTAGMEVVIVAHGIM